MSEEFKNSDNFVKAVQNARIFEPDKDALVIFAGACQSHYEALIESGANFASSPARVSINVLDPVKIAILVATRHVGCYLDINEVFNVFISIRNGIIIDVVYFLILLVSSYCRLRTCYIQN